MKQSIEILKRDAYDLICIFCVFILASAILYGYFAFVTPKGIQTLYNNWDGPAYVVVAKSLYDVHIIQAINPFWFLDATHYAYQLPLYPIFIRLFSFIGYNESMIFSSQLFSLLFSLSLYYLVKISNPKANALVISILSVFYTPSWFMMSHLGSAEPLFIFCITLFMICIEKRKFLLAAVFIGLTQLSKPQGIVFFFGISLYYFLKFIIGKGKNFKDIIKEYFPFFSIPLSLLFICILYYFRFGNFFVFFGNEGVTTMLWPPLKVLTATEITGNVVGYFTAWKDSVIYNVLIYLIPIMLLFEKRKYFFGTIALIYFIPVLFFFQSIMGRLFLPILPFLFLGLSDALSKKAVYIALFLGIPMVYLFSVNYIFYNIAPLPY